MLSLPDKAREGNGACLPKKLEEEPQKVEQVIHAAVRLPEA
jgi:hypothetical protein